MKPKSDKPGSESEAPQESLKALGQAVLPGDASDVGLVYGRIYAIYGGVKSPVADADVRLRSKTDPNQVQASKSDAAGRYGISCKPGEYTLEVDEEIQREGRTCGCSGYPQIPLKVGSGRSPVADVVYKDRAAPDCRHVVGYVYAREGNRRYPLASVRILVLHKQDESPVGFVDTDERGAYEFFPPPGEYLVSAPDKHEDRGEKFVLEPGSTKIPISLPADVHDLDVPDLMYSKEVVPDVRFGVLQISVFVDESALGGSVRSAASGVPVHVAGKSVDGVAIDRTLWTRSDGQLHAPLPEGRYNITFDREAPLGVYWKRPQLVTAEDVDIDIKADATVSIETVYAAENGAPAGKGPGSRISGKAVFQQVAGNASTATPLPGLEVLLYDEAGVEIDSATTSNSGDFAFATDIVPGSYQLRLPDEFDTSAIKAINVPQLRLADRRLQKIDVTVDYEGDEPNIGSIVYVPRAAGIEGVITPRIEGIPVTLINLATQETLTISTDAQGFYHFDQPNPGLYALRLEGFIQDRGLHLKTPPSASFSAGPGKLIQRDFEYIKVGGQVHGFVFLNLDGSGIRSAANPAVPGVEVELSDEAGKKTVLVQKTGDNGEYYFTNLEPGNYMLQFRKLVSDTLKKFDENYELQSAAAQRIQVKVNESAEALPVAYALEPHQIVGRLLFKNSNRPIPGITVILYDEQGRERDRQQTDDDGRYRFQNVKGRFFVKFPEQPTGSQLISSNTVEAVVNSTYDAGDRYYSEDTAPPVPPGPTPPFGGTVQDAIQDIASYMPTSQEVTGPSYGSAAKAGVSLSGGNGDLQGLVNSALVHVLGQKGSVSDGKAFMATLDRAFTIKESNGKSVIEWTPRTYAVETELGGKISGAQASLYYLAESAKEKAIPLLNGIYPLLPDYDEQLTEAARKIVGTEFTELVQALGAEGGPILQRVDDLFVSVNRALDRMRDEFGLTTDRVNTVDEESNLTNFLVVRDYISSLGTTWNAQRGNIVKFLGTKLVLLSRGLSSVVESVIETEDAMDAVYLGPAERQTVRIVFPAYITIDGRREPIFRDANGNPVPAQSMVVGELLSWITRFARDEGPALIRDGGRVGVVTIRPTADRLRRLVIGATEATNTHVGFTRNRVRRALSELAGQLGYVTTLAQELDDGGVQANRPPAGTIVVN